MPLAAPPSTARAAPPPGSARATEQGALLHFAALTQSAELQAAMLALLLVPRTDAAWHAWQIEAGALAATTRFDEYAAQLSGATRLPCFEQLLARMAQQPLADRRRLLHATRRLMRARGVVRPIDRLHWLAMRLRLGEPAVVGPDPLPGADLSAWPDHEVQAIADCSAYLGRLVPAEGGEPTSRSGWVEAVMAPWRERGIAASRPEPDAETLAHALQELQTMAWMKRPVVVRRWVAAALARSPRRELSDIAADALRLTCTLLDCPLPPDLARHYSAATEDPKR